MTLVSGDAFVLGIAGGTLAMLLIIWAVAPKGDVLDTIGLAGLWTGLLWTCVMCGILYFNGTDDDSSMSSTSTLIAFVAAVVHLFVFFACYRIGKMLSSADALKNGTTPASM